MINQGLPEDLFAALQQKASGIPFYDFLGFTPVSFGPGKAVFEVHLRPEYANINQTLHGGVMMSLADAAMAFAARTRGHDITTVTMDTSFFSPVMVGSVLRAEGEVIKHGSHLVYGICRLYNEDQLVGENKGVFYILKP
jgi:uncharacterized protein (TIGR00369 family)